MRTEEEVALDEIHKAHNESFAAGRQRGILKGLRMARKAVRAKGDKGMAVYTGPISAIDALIAQHESTNKETTE